MLARTDDVQHGAERPVTVEMGGNRLVGSDPGRIRAGIEAALAAGRGGLARPPLWDGRAAERIVDILLEETDA